MRPAVGVVLPSRETVTSPHVHAAELPGLAAYAEDLGFGSVWTGDSPLDRHRPDAFVVLGGAAALTTRVRLGTAVLVAPLRHPLLLAQQAASLDVVSGGRVVLGLGAGFPIPSTRRQLERLGLSYERRYTALRDTLAVLREQWGPGPAPDDVVEPRPVQPGGPPVWLAGASPRSVADVAALADGWLPYPPDPADYARQRQEILRRSSELGRPAPTAALMVTVGVDRDPARARRKLDAHVSSYYRQPADLVSLVQAMHAGPASSVAEFVAPYLEAGAEHVVVRVAGDDFRGDLELVRAALPDGAFAWHDLTPEATSLDERGAPTP